MQINKMTYMYKYKFTLLPWAFHENSYTPIRAKTLHFKSMT